MFFNGGGLTVTGDSGCIISNAKHWGTIIAQFSIQKITHWLLAAVKGFQLQQSRIAQQSEGKVFTIGNYLCVRPAEGTDINLKFNWTITGTCLLHRRSLVEPRRPSERSERAPARKRIANGCHYIHAAWHALAPQFKNNVIKVQSE